VLSVLPVWLNTTTQLTGLLLASLLDCGLFGLFNSDLVDDLTCLVMTLSMVMYRKRYIFSTYLPINELFSSGLLVSDIINNLVCLQSGTY